MTWSGTVRDLVELAISDERTVERQRARWVASCRCFEPRVVKLSGCSCTALTVEAAFKGERSSSSRRWVCSPQLGFGLETRRDGKGNDIATLKSA